MGAKKDNCTPPQTATHVHIYKQMYDHKHKQMQTAIAEINI